MLNTYLWYCSDGNPFTVIFNSNAEKSHMELCHSRLVHLSLVVLTFEHFNCNSCNGAC